MERSYAAQKEISDKLKATEAIINKKKLENEVLEGKCLSYKKSINNFQSIVNTYESRNNKLLNTSYTLSSQLNNGKKNKNINTRSYSGFRTIIQDIKKMSVTELQDEVVELRQEIENVNKKNWDLKLEVDRYQSANENNRRTIMCLMKRINDEKNNAKKDEEISSSAEVNDSHNSSYSKDKNNSRNSSSSSLSSKHESNATLLNSETYEEDYSKSSSKLPALSEVDDEETANVSPYLINKSNSSSSSTAINLPIHAMPNHEGFIAKESEARSLSEESSSSDFSMIKVNDEVCIRESLSNESLKYSQDINYNGY